MSAPSGARCDTTSCPVHGSNHLPDTNQVICHNEAGKNDVPGLTPEQGERALSWPFAQEKGLSLPDLFRPCRSSSLPLILIRLTVSFLTVLSVRQNHPSRRVFTPYRAAGHSNPLFPPAYGHSSTRRRKEEFFRSIPKGELPHPIGTTGAGKTRRDPVNNPLVAVRATLPDRRSSSPHPFSNLD